MIAAFSGEDIRLQLGGFRIYTGFTQRKGDLVLYSTIPLKDIQFRPSRSGRTLRYHRASGVRSTPFNGKSDPVVSISRWERLDMVGWVADVQGGTVSEAVGLELSSPENSTITFRLNAYGGCRIFFFKNPDLEWSGFALQLVETRVPTGEYSLHILQSSGTQASWIPGSA